MLCFGPLMHICVVLLLPLFDVDSRINVSLAKNQIFGPFFTTISLLSYSIYLIHYQLILLLASYKDTYWAIFLCLLASILLTFILSWGVYRYIERPFMTIRDRLFPGRGQGAESPVLIAGSSVTV
jgi:peptidoglycan/LPS O-acetylase OafA/YrhL